MKKLITTFFLGILFFSSPIVAKTVVYEGEPIKNFGKEIDSDIIAINTHGRSGLSQLFSESISKELANHALRPIITFKI